MITKDNVKFSFVQAMHVPEDLVARAMAEIRLHGLAVKAGIDELDPVYQFAYLMLKDRFGKTFQEDRHG